MKANQAERRVATMCRAPLPHNALLLCQRHCLRLRQCARHDRLHYLPRSQHHDGAQRDRRALVATSGHLSRLAALGDNAPLAHSASLARASPVTSSCITIAAGDIVYVRHAADRVSSDHRGPVTAPIVVAPLNMSVMSRVAPAPRPPRPFTSYRSGARLGSSPASTFRITSYYCVRASADDADSVLRTSAVTAFSAPRRVLRTTPITTAPVNISVMSRTVQLFDHSADSLRTDQVSARLVPFGDIATLAAVGLATLVLVTDFRTTPCTCVRASARASASLLRTTHFSSVRTHRHSIAVAAPVREFHPRRFPLPSSPRFVVHS